MVNKQDTINKIAKDILNTNDLEIIRGVYKQLHTKLQKTNIIVSSAEELSPSVKSTLETKIRKKYQSIQLGDFEYLLDPSLIAGFKVKIGDMVFDNTVQSKLHNIKNNQ